MASESAPDSVGRGCGFTGVLLAAAAAESAEARTTASVDAVRSRRAKSTATKNSSAPIATARHRFLGTWAGG